MKKQETKSLNQINHIYQSISLEGGYNTVPLSLIKTPSTFEEFRENLFCYFYIEPTARGIYTNKEEKYTREIYLADLGDSKCGALSSVNEKMLDIGGNTIVPLMFCGEIYDLRKFNATDIFRIEWPRNDSIHDIHYRDIYTHILGDFICFDHPDMDVGIRIPPDPEYREDLACSYIFYYE